MMWAGLLLILCILFIAALVWKPSKQSANVNASARAVMDRLVAPEPVRRDALDDEISIIAEAIREQDAKRKRASAMGRLKQLLEEYGG